MLKDLTVASVLIFSSLSFATTDERDKPTNWWDLTDTYIDLMQEYKETAQDQELPQSEKADKLKEIAEDMRKAGGETYLNEDYNDCMKESNAQQRSDYDRCDKNDGGDKCYDRADKNNDDRRSACERVAHSDNAAKKK